jgi:hypothetical protein
MLPSEGISIGGFLCAYRRAGALKVFGTSGEFYWIVLTEIMQDPAPWNSTPKARFHDIPLMSGYGYEMSPILVHICLPTSN